MNRIVALVLVAALGLSGCATLADTTHEVAASIDEGAQKVEASIAVIRAGIQPIAAQAVALCKVAPVDPSACDELNSLASKLFEALNEADAALAVYEAGKGDFIDAYDAASRAFELAQDYVAKVAALVARARA